MCGKCVNRKECVNLCATAEEYVSQDHVSIKEGLININIENREKELEYDDEYDYFDESIDSRFLSARFRAAVKNLHLDGKSADEISYHVPFSLRHIQRIIKELKEKNDKI